MGSPLYTQSCETGRVLDILFESILHQGQGQGRVKGEAEASATFVNRHAPILAKSWMVITVADGGMEKREIQRG